MHRTSRLNLQHAAPTSAARSSLDEADSRLLRTIDAAFSEAVRRAGPRIVCRPGCDSCCHGPFPITALDARRLRAGLAALRERDAPRAAAIEARAAAALAVLAAGYPGDLSTGRLRDSEEDLDAFFALHASLPCPVLEPGTGRCELYEHRPVPCRAYGPPLLYGSERAPHCPLCFEGSSAAEIEACRVEPDPRDLENAILDAMDGAEGGLWETLIALALAPPRRGDR